jgi:DprA winged helix domain/HNH endonuclease
MSVRRARERVRVGRALRELPAIASAFVEGTVGYARVREVTRVATAADEGRWLQQAIELPLRVLERRVAEASGGSNDERAKAREPAGVRWTSSKTLKLEIDLPAATWALLQRAMEGARRASEATLCDADALEAVAREALAREADDGERSDVRRMVVLYACKACRRAELETGAGAVELDEATAARLGCGAARVDLDEEGRSETVGGPIPAAVRRAVLLRDRMRCRAPGCFRRRHVDVHHIVPREHGGKHARANCVTLCTGCHDRLHEGRLSIHGSADAELDFRDERGSRLGGPAMTPGGHGALDASPEATTLLDVMGSRGGWHVDDLIEASSLDVSAISAALFELEISGRVRRGVNGYEARPGGG